ncbi:hypothetical protein ABZ912_29360 [Nonomuraea angiospora]|uniref:hypothetical protein n=1 Tax=Nonomuraea angiospora TaxID=46172 RepID=UPI0033D7CCFD
MRAQKKDWTEPILTCWNCWIAVSTGDRMGVMEVLGLSELRPITFAEAEELIDSVVHSGRDDPHRLSQVVVTPEVDGWTLVVGPWCDPCDSERHENVLASCLALSARYGKAQAYYFGEQGDGSAWLLTEDGSVIRRYAATCEPGDALLALGDPLPQEEARRLGLGLPVDLEAASSEEIEEWTYEAFDLAPDIATAYGVSTLSLTRETTVRGNGVLALTPDAPG